MSVCVRVRVKRVCMCECVSECKACVCVCESVTRCSCALVQDETLLKYTLVKVLGNNFVFSSSKLSITMLLSFARRDKARVVYTSRLSVTKSE